MARPLVWPIKATRSAGWHTCARPGGRSGCLRSACGARGSRERLRRDKARAGHRRHTLARHDGPADNPQRHLGSARADAPPSQPWCPSDLFVRRPRRRTWDTRRLATRGNTRPRRDVRVRHPSGSVRSGGKGARVCSALRNRPAGRRTYRAGQALRATARQIVRGYRRRWAVELFHQ